MELAEDSMKARGVLPLVEKLLVLRSFHGLASQSIVHQDAKDVDALRLRVGFRTGIGKDSQASCIAVRRNSSTQPSGRFIIELPDS